ncbi:MAG: DUF2513 domain-containing protein [Bacteroidota bacterium]
MKRDMDLIRDLLLDLEAREEPRAISIPKLEGYSPQQIAYHLGLLKQAGLIEAVAIRDRNGAGWLPESITWEGHEFLAAAKDEKHWGKAKRLVKDKGGALTFEALKTAMTEMTKRAILFAISAG